MWSDAKQYQTDQLNRIFSARIKLYQSNGQSGSEWFFSLSFALISPFFSSGRCDTRICFCDRNRTAGTKNWFFWEYKRFMFHITIFFTDLWISPTTTKGTKTWRHTQYGDLNGMMRSFKSNVSHIRMHIRIKILPFFLGIFFLKKISTIRR